MCTARGLRFVHRPWPAVQLTSPHTKCCFQIDALKEFEGHVIDPHDAGAVLEKFSFDSDKEEAAGVLAEFSPAKAGTLVAPTFEQDVGSRSDDDMDALIAKLEDISMSDDKVAAILEDVAAKPTPPFDTQQLIRLLGCFSFSSDAVAVLEALLGPKAVYSMTCADIVTVLSTFSMSSDQMQVLPPLKAFIADPQNKLAIVASFSFSSDQEAAEEILRDVVVRFTPPQPSPEVMQALARVGSCPSGYTWREVQGGYRCAAGGHFVSAERLAEAMS